jgi:hypothetical protein
MVVNTSKLIRGIDMKIGVVGIGHGLFGRRNDATVQE